jgi:hypothetical protein
LDFDNLILVFDAGNMKSSQTVTKPAAPAQKTAHKSLWVKTPFANLIHYVPSGTYFARIRVKGKLVRQSLKTDVLSVAKLPAWRPGKTRKTCC